MATAVLGALPGGAEAANASTPKPHIVGGTPATESYPFAVSLQIDKNGDPNHNTCGGTLIAQSWVETNAHCVTNDDASAKDPSLYHVRVGSNDRTTGGTVAQVTRIEVYPTWDWLADDGVNNDIGDIALLKLDKKINGAIAIADRTAAVGSSLRELGWGHMDPAGADDPPTQLQQLDTPVLAYATCGEGDFKIGPGEICLDTPGPTGSCNGDSGGPALEKSDGRWLLSGSTSRGTGDLCGEGPDVYTDVTHYRGWINGILRNLG